MDAIMEVLKSLMTGDLMGQALTFLIGIGGLGIFISKGLGKVTSLLKEVYELLVAVLDAFKADKDGTVRLTSKELDRIKKEAKDILPSVKAFKGLKKSK